MKTVNSHTSKGRVTQSYRLYQLFSRKGNAVTRDQIASTLKLKPEYVGSYLSELKRVYGAKIKYDNSSERYRLQNRINVPKEGIAGRRTIERLPRPGLRGRPRTSQSLAL